MQASFRLVVTALVLGLSSVMGGQGRAIAQTTSQTVDSDCFMQAPSGQVVNLSYLCGAAPPEGRVPSASSRVTDCKQLEQVLSPSLREIVTTIQATNSKNALQQAGKATQTYDRMIARITAIPMSNPNLITLRSQYVRDLKDSNTLLKRMVQTARTGNTKATTELFSQLQSTALRGMPVGVEIDRYCGFTTK